MNRFLCLLLLLFPLFGTTTSAQVYSWVDESGRTHYSDRPAPGANALTTNRVSKPSTADETDAMQSGEAVKGPYTSFEIVSPEPDQTLRQTTDKLPFSLILAPQLMAGHQIELVLDGSPILVDASMGYQFSLSGVSYGSHIAVAQIRGPEGQLISRTAPINFHLRKPLPPGVIQ